MLPETSDPWVETGIKADPLRKKRDMNCCWEEIIAMVCCLVMMLRLLHLVRNIWPRAKHPHAIVNKRKLTQWLESSCTHTHRCTDKSGVCVC